MLCTERNRSLAGVGPAVTGEQTPMTITGESRVQERLEFCCSLETRGLSLNRNVIQMSDQGMYSITD